jgi:hypothetical protein
MQERFSVRDERRGSALVEMRRLSARSTPRSHYYTLILIHPILLANHHG